MTLTLSRIRIAKSLLQRSFAIVRIRRTEKAYRDAVKPSQFWRSERLARIPKNKSLQFLFIREKIKSMEIITHVAGVAKQSDRQDVQRCQRCDCVIPLPEDTNYQIGMPVGVITGLKFTPDASYPIKKPQFDSNKLCVELTE